MSNLLIFCNIFDIKTINYFQVNKQTFNFNSPNFLTACFLLKARISFKKRQIIYIKKIGDTSFFLPSPNNYVQILKKCT